MSKQAVDRVAEGSDIIDSRDVIEAIEEMQAERDAARERGEEYDEADELAALEALAEQAEGYVDDWAHGAALIRDSYFETYAQELAEDLGAINASASWPNNCIDWEQAARELQMDYTSVEYGSTTYWVR